MHGQHIKKQGRVSFVRVPACKIMSASEFMSACGIMEKHINTRACQPGSVSACKIMLMMTVVMMMVMLMMKNV